MPILAFSMRVGPPAALTTFWLRTTPSTNSVSSMVPPTFLTIRMSRRSTFEDVGVTSRVTADTAMGARVEEYCDTIYRYTVSIQPYDSVADLLWSLTMSWQRVKEPICLSNRQELKVLLGTRRLLPTLSGRTRR